MGKLKICLLFKTAYVEDDISCIWFYIGFRTRTTVIFQIEGWELNGRDTKTAEIWDIESFPQFPSADHRKQNLFRLPNRFNRVQDKCPGNITQYLKNVDVVYSYRHISLSFSRWFNWNVIAKYNFHKKKWEKFLIPVLGKNFCAEVRR